MARLKLFLPLVIALAMGSLFFIVLNDKDYNPQALPSALIDKPLPPFDLPLLMSSARVTQADLQGKVALLNVWATWCPTCRVEHPYLIELTKREKLPIFGINYKDENDKAKQWLAELGNPYQFNIVDQQGRLGLDLGVYGAPETYLIDRQGVIRYKHVGVVNERLWQDKLGAMVAQLRREGR